MRLLRCAGESGASTERTEKDMPDETRETIGMRVMFWTWAGIIAIGLAVMIGLPLGGR